MKVVRMKPRIYIVEKAQIKINKKFTFLLLKKRKFQFFLVKLVIVIINRKYLMTLLKLNKILMML